MCMRNWATLAHQTIHSMRAATLLLLFTLLSAVPVHATPSVPVASTVQVVLHIDGFSDDVFARLAKEVGRERTTAIEYSCTWSGVVVLQFTEAPVTERADAVTMTRRLLARVGIEQGIEFLHITMEAQGPGKC